tara:strand:+ start:2024 stop:2341 length:318 start_codon:yes stop_codon:yes gene_type:complete
MNPEIERICGLSDYIPDFEAIGNNPNYVFTNDPNYLTVQLLDSNGSVINVNSWIECANYVNGGWSDNLKTFINYEKYLFFVLLIATFSYIGAKYLIQIRSKNFKK